MSELANLLLAEEETLLRNLQVFRDVYVNMVERETVVPVAVQDELWSGFTDFLSAQQDFVGLMKQKIGEDLLSIYKQKGELVDMGMMKFVGNVPRALGHLLEDLLTNNQWKIYMESTLTDARVKGKDFHAFLVAPRSHVNNLLKIAGRFEEGQPLARHLELVEQRIRASSGKLASSGKGLLPGLNKLKGPSVDFLERPTRRCLREGKFLMATSSGKTASKKKAKESGYWLCDDCLLWGALKGPIKGCVRLISSTLSVERLDEGGFLLELSDSGLGSTVGVLCELDSQRCVWEQELTDWMVFCSDADRRAKRDEAERMKADMQERARQDAERIRLLEQERVKIEAEKVERAKKMEEERKRAEEERKRLEAERAKKMEEERKKAEEERKRFEADRAKKMEEERKRAEEERKRIEERVEEERRKMEQLQEESRIRMDEERARKIEEEKRKIEEERRRFDEEKRRIDEERRRSEENKPARPNFSPSPIVLPNNNNNINNNNMNNNNININSSVNRPLVSPPVSSKSSAPPPALRAPPSQVQQVQSQQRNATSGTSSNATLGNSAPSSILSLSPKPQPAPRAAPRSSTGVAAPPTAVGMQGRSPAQAQNHLPVPTPVSPLSNSSPSIGGGWVSTTSTPGVQVWADAPHPSLAPPVNLTPPPSVSTPPAQTSPREHPGPRLPQKRELAPPPWEKKK